MMKSRSIKVKFFAAISVVALVFIGVLLLLNLFFYDDYYLMTRKNELRNTYQSVLRGFRGSAHDVAALLDELENNGPTRLAIISPDGHLLYASSYIPELENGEPPFDEGFSMENGDQGFRSIEVLIDVMRYMGWETPEELEFLTVSLMNDQYLCLAGPLEWGACLVAYNPLKYIRNNN